MRLARVVAHLAALMTLLATAAPGGQEPKPASDQCVSAASPLGLPQRGRTPVESAILIAGPRLEGYLSRFRATDR